MSTLRARIPAVVEGSPVFPLTRLPSSFTRRVAWASTSLAVLMVGSACSSSEPATMPDVVGMRLDVALSDVERAGFDEEVEVLGGGMFGVVDQTNWTVCGQEPADGAEIASAPRVTVERTCEAEEQPQDVGEQSESGGDPATGDPKPKKKKRRAAVPDNFEMPYVVGRNLQVAQNLLQARGSFMLTQTDGTGQDRFQMVDYNWKVCVQDPAPGDVVSVATLVELVAVKTTEAC